VYLEIFLRIAYGTNGTIITQWRKKTNWLLANVSQKDARYLSQGKVATRLSCSKIFNDDVIGSFILKIDQHSTESRARLLYLARFVSFLCNQHRRY